MAKPQALEPLLLQRWVRDVREGRNPTIADPETREVIALRMPLARSDGDGLTFTLSRAGTATWILRYRYGGRQKELTIGNYPDISLAQARKIAREERAKVDGGADPASDKRRAVVFSYRDLTVRSLVADYREKVLSGLAPSTQISYGRNLDRAEAKIGSITVSQITPLDIVALLDETHTTWSESYTLLCAIKGVFRHAVGKRLIAINPCVGIELNAVVGRRPPIRQRLMLTDEELHVVLNATMNRENLLSVCILAGTGVRSEELYRGKKINVFLDEARWHIPGSKTGPAMDIPLAPIVVEWFRELLDLSAASDYVLPTRASSRATRNGGDTHINRNTIAAAIDFWIDEHKPKIRRFTPHDLRSTMKSHMRKLGVSRDVSEMCLNHKLPGVEGIYDQYTYYDERREALELWAEFLDLCRRGKSAGKPGVHG
ncbi:integrase [Burkholderia stagnalis]|uniref:tyrosine-type recombinase/integrase n=1 Tax=Burkholderia stagnalis TaxID=1503054 RepID=UPI00075A3D7C|nr:site-specific integrase [Burkholderia stagnalis]KVN13905.1 integrase [Burkholderia stagnalis]